MRGVIGFLLLFFIVGCGYKPSATYAKRVLQEKVSTEVLISMRDPENSVLIKDALNDAVLTRFHASLTDKEHADTHLRIALTDIRFSPLQYNQEGYVVTYRTHVTLQVLRTRGDTAKTYITTGRYDFAIEPNAIISDRARYEAIKESSLKAINNFIASVAAEGAVQGKGEDYDRQ